MSEPTKYVSADTLNRVVWRLGNQLPVQFYLDADGDASYRTVAIDIHFKDAKFPRKLHEELQAMGFIHVTDTRWSRWTNGRFIRRWQALREPREADPNAFDDDEETPYFKGMEDLTPLSSREEWEEWNRGVLGAGSIAEPPEKYPCIAYTYITEQSIYSGAYLTTEDLWTLRRLLIMKHPDKQV